MQKASWKYKRMLNQVFFNLRSFPQLARGLKNLIYRLRCVLRQGEEVYADAAVEKIYSEKHQYLYVANPKVATRSLIDYFESYDAASMLINHQTIQRFLADQPAMQHYFRFSFVRNPWARVYSCWLDKITNQHKFCDASIISRFKGLYPDMPFAAFVEWLCSEEGGDRFADRHWMSQCELLGGSHVLAEYDFIGRLENIEHDFRQLAKHIGIGPETLPSLNLNQSDPNAYRQYYSQTSKDLVANRYSNDIQSFGYEF
jgi:hypothetical protein